MFYELEPNYHSRFGISDEPRLPYGTSFIQGKPYPEKIVTPMIFKSSFTKEDPPKEFEGYSIPVWSKYLVDFLHTMGINNFECFDAIIKSRQEDMEWNNFYAVNIVGWVSDIKLTGSLELFRLVDSPGAVVVHERIFKALKQDRSPEDWGFLPTLIKI